MKNILHTWVLPAVAPLILCLSLFATYTDAGILIIGLVSFIATLMVSYSVCVSSNPLIAIAETIAATIAMALIFSDFSVGLLIVLLYAPAGICTGYALRLKKNINSAAMSAIIFSLALVIAVFFVYTYENTVSFSVTDAVTSLKELVRPVADEMYEMLDSLDVAVIKNFGYDKLLELGKEGFFNQIIIGIIQSIAYIAPIIVLGIVALCYFICRRLLKITGSDIKDLTLYDSVHISKITAYVYMTVLVAEFIGSLFVAADSPVLIMLTAVDSALRAVFFFSAMSFIYYYMRTVRGESARKCITVSVFLYIICTFISFLFAIISFLGLLDSFNDIRGKLGGGGKI